jgi:hypothetical protein
MGYRRMKKRDRRYAKVIARPAIAGRSPTAEPAGMDGHVSGGPARGITIVGHYSELV